MVPALPSEPPGRSPSLREKPASDTTPGCPPAPRCPPREGKVPSREGRGLRGFAVGICRRGESGAVPTLPGSVSQPGGVCAARSPAREVPALPAASRPCWPPAPAAARSPGGAEVTPSPPALRGESLSVWVISPQC